MPRGNNIFQKNIDTTYPSFFENSMEGILAAKKYGNILQVNKVACKIFKLTESGIINAQRAGLINVEECRLNVLLQEPENTECNVKNKNIAVEYSSLVNSLIPCN